jgi:lipid-binding SYLF domain-containing protein
MRVLQSILAATVLLLGSTVAGASDYSDTVALFKNAKETSRFFHECYGYAVFPTIGKGGLVVGAAHGDGRVYAKGVWVGDVSMTQVSVGLQAGGQAYSQMIFFQDKRALDEFSSGNFELGAGVSAVAITAAAQGSASTEGVSGGASGGQHDAKVKGNWYKGLAIFTIVKGGAMAEASVAGQKFTYKPKGQTDKDD